MWLLRRRAYQLLVSCWCQHRLHSASIQLSSRKLKPRFVTARITGVIALSVRSTELEETHDDTSHSHGVGRLHYQQ